MSRCFLAAIKRLKETLGQDEYEEKLFVCGELFKNTIPKMYDYTCCITGMKVQSSHKIQIIDACLIYPFSLSPTLHRTFDRGLIT